MTLEEMTKGQIFEIVGIEDKGVLTQALRFGLSVGSRASCVRKLGFGPVVLRLSNQEIAIARRLAQGIEVRALQTASEQG